MKVAQDISHQDPPEFLSRLPLTGVDTNAFALMGTVQRGLRQAGAPKEFRDAFLALAMAAHSWDAMLAVCVRFTDPDCVVDRRFVGVDMDDDGANERSGGAAPDDQEFPW